MVNLYMYAQVLYYKSIFLEPHFDILLYQNFDLLLYQNEDFFIFQADKQECMTCNYTTTADSSNDESKVEESCDQRVALPQPSTL